MNNYSSYCILILCVLLKISVNNRFKKANCNVNISDILLKADCKAEISAEVYYLKEKLEIYGIDLKWKGNV